MKKTLLSLLFALAFVFVTPQPVQAALMVRAASDIATSGTITNINDTVTLAISGAEWATAKWQVTTAGTSLITTEISIDGGTNWIAAAYSKRLDLVSPNPNVLAFQGGNGTVASTFETPLPSNATQFRLRCSTTGTATTVTLSGSLPYVPGVPVTATLYDVTSAFTVAQSTGTLDTSGWGSLIAVLVNSDTGGTNRNLTASMINDAGTALAMGGFNVNSGAISGMMLGSGSVGTGGGAFGFSAPLPKRTLFLVTAGTGAGGSAEFRIEARR